MHSLFTLATLYAYLALFQIVPSVNFHRLIAVERAVHGALCDSCSGAGSAAPVVGGSNE